MRRIVGGALLAVTVVLVGACTTTVEGSAIKASGGPPPGTVDPSQLDVGPYPTEPSPPLGVAGDEKLGLLIEGQRMANNVVGPWEADSTLTASFGFGAAVLKSPDAMALIGPQAFAPAVAKHDFINGFATARSAGGQKVLMNAVLRFPDAQAAAAANADLGDLAIKTGKPPVRPVPIPGHADTVAASYTDAAGPSGQQLTAVLAFTAHGQYVFMQLAQAVDGLDPAVDMIAKTIDLQGPMIDKFRATDPTEFTDISIDPTELLARTLQVPERQATVVQNATYERPGALQFQNDPVRSATLFDKAGMDLVAMGLTNVYHTEDSEGAAQIVDGFFAELQPNSQPANPVKNLPDSRCLKLQDQSFYCLAAAGGDAIEASGTKLLDVQQQVAAQYVILTTS